MKVWELMAKLSTCPAGADVNVGIGPTMNVESDQFEHDDMVVSIRASSDVEVVLDDSSTTYLSELTAGE